MQPVAPLYLIPRDIDIIHFRMRREKAERHIEGDLPRLQPALLRQPEVLNLLLLMMLEFLLEQSEVVV